MAVSDLLLLVRHNLKFVIVVPVLLAAVTIIYGIIVPPNYTATASFVTNGDLALAQGLASKEALSYTNSEIKIGCSASTSSKQIIVTAEGSNSSACISTANEVANNAVKQYKDINNEIVATISEATYAVDNDPPLLRSVFISLIAGFFFAIFIIILVDVIKLPIKSSRDIEDAVSLSVLGYAPSPEDGERLLANLQFRNNGRPSTVAIVPVGAATAAPIVARELAGALERSDIRVKLVKGSPHAKKFQVSVPDDAAIVVSCEPLDDGMGAAYIAHNADATIVCVAEWIDSKKQLALTVQELNLAKANIAGAVIIPEEKKPKKPRDEKQS